MQQTQMTIGDSKTRTCWTRSMTMIRIYCLLMLRGGHYPRQRLRTIGRGSEASTQSLLRNVLESQWRDHLDRYPDCPYFFHRKGRRIRYPYVGWRKACREAGLSDKIRHDFRRTAVRNMVRAGIPERVAMQIAGHKTRSIFDRYHIVSDGDLQEAAKRLEVAFGTQTTTLSTTLPLLTEEKASVTH
jgi:hypothetical protein